MQCRSDCIQAEEDSQGKLCVTNDRMVQKRWKPTVKRTITLMNTARQLAVEKHDAITKSKIGLPVQRPSKAVTPFQKARKRRAEICRLKFSIFIDLLEEAYKKEIQTCEDLRCKLRIVFSEVEQMNNRITQLENYHICARVTFDNVPSLSTKESSTHRCPDEKNVLLCQEPSSIYGCSRDQNGRCFLKSSNSLLQICDDNTLHNSILELE